MKLTVGSKVCMNTLPDAVVFTVSATDGRMVSLEYVSEFGKVLRGGAVDHSLCFTPSAEQLKGEHHAK